MAVSKQELVEYLTEQERSLVNDLEKEIDQYLRETYAMGGTVYFTITRVSLSSLSKRVKDRIKALYENKGWTVEFKFEQRDGNSIVFS